MPLIKSSSDDAFDRNIGQLKRDKYPQKQALAIAYDVQRRNRRAAGGGIGNCPDPEPESLILRFASGGGIGADHAPDPGVVLDEPHPGGPIVGLAAGGRTDRVPLRVDAGSHVMPADYFSGIGQDDSNAGFRLFMKALRKGPYGVAPPKIKQGSGPPTLSRVRQGYAVGGDTPQTSILAAGGEFVVPLEEWVGEDPEDGNLYWHRGVREIGGGDPEAGHRYLNDSIKNVRDFHIKWLRKAPPPKD